MLITMKRLLFFLPFTLLLQSCVTLYKPNMINSPMLTKQGEFGVTAAMSTTGSGLFNGQAAVAVTDNFSVMANVMYHTNDENYSNDIGEGNGELTIFSFDGGLGYTAPMTENGSWYTQLYGGGGIGEARDVINYANQEDPKFTADYYNIFLQPGVFYRRKNIDMGFDLRANYVNVNNINAYLYEEFEWWNTDYVFASDSSLDFMIIEPTFTFRAGGRNLKGLFQFGLTIPTLNPDNYYAVNGGKWFKSPVKFSLGVNYTFRRKEAE